MGDVLVATPNRLLDLIKQTLVSVEQVLYLTLDEADFILDSGFESEIRSIVTQQSMPRAGQRQTLMFSETFPTRLAEIASDFLHNFIFLTVGRDIKKQGSKDAGKSKKFGAY